MPELPEVEHARRCLERWLTGHTVTRAFSRTLVGRRVTSVARRGKWLRLTLTDGVLLFSHLGMTGRWLRRAPDDPLERWERARVDVEGASARYADPRRFGRLVVSREELPAWSALGPDPLADGIETRALGRALARRSRTVKEALMDQALLAGVGNILATEALWSARIDPRARTDALSPGDVSAVARGLRAAIARGLALQEGDDSSYVQDAGAENPFRIYGRAGQPCPRCRTVMKRIVLGAVARPSARVASVGSERTYPRADPVVTADAPARHPDAPAIHAGRVGSYGGRPRHPCRSGGIVWRAPPPSMPCAPAIHVQRTRESPACTKEPSRGSRSASRAHPPWMLGASALFPGRTRRPSLVRSPRD